jgi:hypothetical protein
MARNQDVGRFVEELEAQHQTRMAALEQIHVQELQQFALSLAGNAA